ncbi:MAG: MGMT family protein [Candidatus Aenigmarchaeota archaeon]|nr:MGMT family protein [Candidatus Aenigmarchaeota archaeon]
MHESLLLLKKIPRGKVTTYGILAGMTNSSPRAVGRIMACNKEPEKYPCYKVVLSSGEVGNYSGKGGRRSKIKLLEKDGVIIKNGKINRGYFWFFNQ